MNVGRRLRGHPLATGGHLDIEVQKARYGIVFQFVIGRSQTPTFVKRCLVSASKKADRVLAACGPATGQPGH